MSTATLTYGQAAGGVREVIASYSQALDDGRVGDVVAAFCPDGSVELPGLGVATGHDAIRALYARITPGRPARHVVVNIHVTEWTDHQARAVSDLIVVAQGRPGWSVQLVGRYYDALHHRDGAWRFHARTLEFVE
jgi:hypothetical protein